MTKILFGPNADDEMLMWGNYNGTPLRTVTILVGIKAKSLRIKVLQFCSFAVEKVTVPKASLRE